MSLLYNGNKEKRDPKEFKKLLADLESRRKKGVAPTKKQQVEKSSENEEDTISSVPESSTKGTVSKEDSSNFDIQSPEEETQNPLSVQEKIQDTKKQQVEELNAFKSDINSELAKQNKGISNIEDDLERMEQKMFHSQGGDKTSKDDVSEYSSNEEYTEGFNLQGIKNLFTDQANEKTSNWIAGLAAGGQALWNYAKDGLFGDDKEETKEPKINVPPSPNDPDYEYKKNLYAKQHPELQNPELQKEIQELQVKQAKEVQKSPENKLPPIEQKDTQDSQKEQKTRVMSTVEYYREVINDPRSSKLEVAEAKLKLAEHIQANKNAVEMASWDPESEVLKRQGQEAQAYLDSVGDISDINMDIDKLRDDVEQEKANKEFKRKQLTQKEDISWWEKLIGRKETEKLDSKLKKQIEDEELDIIEVKAIYNNLKNNPVFNIEDKKFLETKIAGYEASLAQAAGKDVDSNKTSSTESQSKGEVSSEKINTEVSDVVEKSVEKADKIEKETKDNVKDVSNVNLVDEKKVSDVIKVEKENIPDPEIQSTATTTQGQNLTIPDSSPSPSGAPAGGGGGAGNNSENKNETAGEAGGGGGGGGGGATETAETAGNNLEKKEIDTVSSDGTAAPVGGSSEINSTNGNVTNSGSSPESKVTPNQDSKELAKQTSPEVKPDIVENVNNQKEIQTYYQKKGNFEQFDNANLNEKAKKVLGTT